MSRRANLRVICGPAGAGKTETLLQRFRERVRAVPGSALWLSPTRRAADAIRERLQASDKGLFGYRLSTFPEFVESVLRHHDPTARLLNHAQRRLLIEEVVADLEMSGELVHFSTVLDTRGFSEGMIGLLIGLKRSEITPAQFARAAYQRGFPPGQQQVPPVGRQIGSRSIRRKDRECARIYARYQRTLHRENLLDVEDRMVRASVLLREGKRTPYEPVQAVFLDGFLTFTRSQQDILETLCSWIDELWVALPDETGNRRPELFTRPRGCLQMLRRLTPQPIQITNQGPAELPGKPAGLVHLERQLFRPLRQVEQGSDASGLACIEAPGALGEARMIARRIKKLLLQGVAPDEVLVTVREVAPYADLLREVFGEYGLRVDIEGHEALIHSPPVALLLRALRLPEEGWPFPGVTALLRNNYFRPQWVENIDRPDLPARTEALLRLLGEPRGREAYLASARRWAAQILPGLEDEQAEESRRRRTHELARECLPFLERFFQTWDGMPTRAPLDAHLNWLRFFINDLGLTTAASEERRDTLALECFLGELDRWQERLQGTETANLLLDRKTLHTRLTALANETGLSRSPRGPGRIRVLSAELARHLETSYLFIMGLGERSFPQLSGPLTLLDEHERAGFSEAGLELPGTGDPLPDEMLLFYQMVTRAQKQLVLSYPAVDERGQDLLPSSFLLTIRECFQPDVVPTERRRMLTEEEHVDQPLSPAEYRLSLASQWQHLSPEQVQAQYQAIRPQTRLPDFPYDLWANLIDGVSLLHHRLRTREYNSYDGLLRDSEVVNHLQKRFGPQKVFSPTALEDYVACPFRFFLRHVLRLDPLEAPGEEIEVTRRGQAFHRALARLHLRLKQQGIHTPDVEVNQAVQQEMDAAVEEDINRAPSPTAKQLWQLEGKRLLRVAGDYTAQWSKFLKPWQERGVVPQPHFFEVDFGLPADPAKPSSPETTVIQDPLVIRNGELEVRISGRIDRVDLAELPDGVGFWIIDYKTGRGSHYTSADLSEFRRLQLTLYALAVEQVLLAREQARPLGLAYWLVGDGGAKVVLPTRNQVLWFDETHRWQQIREQLQGWVLTVVHNIRQGAFPLHPNSEHCTQTCSYGHICRISQARAVGKPWDPLMPGTCSKNAL